MQLLCCRSGSWCSVFATVHTAVDEFLAQQIMHI